ncbi:hypothetical protein ACM0BK_16795, partial [Mycobacteroides abscessus subsp. abscessus]
YLAGLIVHMTRTLWPSTLDTGSLPTHPNPRCPAPPPHPRAPPPPGSLSAGEPCERLRGAQPP